MNEKNTVINNYVNSLVSMVSNLATTLAGMGSETETNKGLIKTADIIITSINSQIVVLQSELDNYEV